MLRVQQLEPVGSPTPRVTNTPRQTTHDNPMGYNQETRQRIKDSEARIQYETNRIKEFETKEESDEEPEHQYDPLEEQQLLRLTSGWNFGEPESSFDSDGIPYDSNSPADVANWNA
ncbi:hypothetical protein CGCA056_v014640 [Colletotrichum aenigma]|uniref:uncharacterized protein n=1 Tax=Colletotrichum aenigma TaxID=1215731 RepID=UPI0018733E86|nr:uncharacterized protein CGCA056_v014640 [Colletotrichum aenigma]KAF5502802.1 hypothetical protein CGCA056_v014640 [Colletotrichum aenigma]